MRIFFFCFLQFFLFYQAAFSYQLNKNEVLVHWCFDQEVGDLYLPSEQGRGNKMLLNGAQYLALDEGLDLPNQMSLALWFNASAINANQVFFDQQSINGFAGYCFGLEAGGTVRIELTDVMHQEIISMRSFVVPRHWFFIAFVIDEEQVTVYLGKQGETLQKRIFPISGFEPYANRSKCILGSDVQKEKGFVGSLDDITVWRRVLSSAEVQTLYQEPLPCGQDNNVVIAPSTRDTIYIRDTLACPDILIDSILNTKIEYQHTIVVNTPEVILMPYDHSTEDGDTVSINVAGVWIAELLRLKKEDKLNPQNNTTFRITLQPNVEYPIISYPHNIGTTAPNTLALRITDKKGKILKEVVLNGFPAGHSKATQGKSGALKLVYIP